MTSARFFIVDFVSFFVGVLEEVYMLLLSLCLILLLGIVLSFLCEKLRMPSLIGYLAIGIILGPFVFNLIDIKLLNISEELRKIALIFILIRAGLSLDFSELKKWDVQQFY